MIMKILTKHIISAYAIAIMDLIETKPSDEKTKNIVETIDTLCDIWESDKSREDYDMVQDRLNTARKIVDNAYIKGRVLDLDNDDFVYAILPLIELGKFNN